MNATICNIYIHTTTDHHYHTVQGCSSTVEYVCQGVEGKRPPGASCNGWHHHRCKECLQQWLKEKRHQHREQPATTTMCASGVHALVDRRDNTSTRCKVQGARCKGQDQHQHKSVSDAATTFNYNHHHHTTDQEQHSMMMQSLQLV